MSTTSIQVLEMLSGGLSVSGEIIGRKLGVSRMAVSKCIRGLVDQGLPITSVPGKGYQLQTPVQLLDNSAIHARLIEAGKHPHQLDILHEVQSTSDYLLERLEDEDIHRYVCLAENQSAGRGRRQRGWHAAAYRNIAMSVGWKFDDGMSGLSGLGIASGITLVEALHDAGFDTEIGLKWPNDLIWMDQKLGGLIIDVRGEHNGPCQVVLGFGLNISLSIKDKQAIDQPSISLEEIGQAVVDRNRLASLLLIALFDLFENYHATDFKAWHEQWKNHDRLLGRSVQVSQGETTYLGRAMGIDEQGALQLDEGGAAYKKFFSGDVSLRLQP